MKPVRTYVINAVTAAAVSLAAITSGAVPAAAKDDDMLKVLAGIAAVARLARPARVAESPLRQPPPRSPPALAGRAVGFGYGGGGMPASLFRTACG